MVKGSSIQQPSVYESACLLALQSRRGITKGKVYLYVKPRFYLAKLLKTTRLALDIHMNTYVVSTQTH